VERGTSATTGFSSIARIALRMERENLSQRLIRFASIRCGGACGSETIDGMKRFSRPCRGGRVENQWFRSCLASPLATILRPCRDGKATGRLIGARRMTPLHGTPRYPPLLRAVMDWEIPVSREDAKTRRHEEFRAEKQPRTPCESEIMVARSIQRRSLLVARCSLLDRGFGTDESRGFDGGLVSNSSLARDRAAARFAHVTKSFRKR